MSNTIKASIILWSLAGFLAPFVLLELLAVLGIRVSGILPWLISIPLCGYFAYRSYAQGTPQLLPGGTPSPATQSGASSTAARIGTALVGAGVGFGVGYVTRPTFLGQKLPLGVLFEKAPQQFAQVQSDFALHMAIATGIGLLAAVALTKFAASARKS